MVSQSVAPLISKEFAVIATGGKQYVVSPGTMLKIEKLQGEHKDGETLTFDKVLIVDNGTDTTIGTPFIDGAKVTGTIKAIGRNKKVETIKYKQKSRYFVRRGHRQPYFLIKIESIK
ncbi:MAG TPA: 50S ribosomal protein L21 [Candidatus Paceibacterota bacterium]